MLLTCLEAGLWLIFKFKNENKTLHVKFKVWLVIMFRFLNFLHGNIFPLVQYSSVPELEPGFFV